MGSFLKKTLCILFVILCLCNSNIRAQLFGDSAAVSLIKSGIDRIYNLQFGEAQEINSEIKKLYSEHPVEYLYHGIMIYWQYYPLQPSSPEKEVFEEDMRKCIRLSEKNSYEKKYEAESVLANLCARGLLLLFYTDNKMNINVIPVATSSYKYLMRSFNYNTIYADLYYFTGLYNYYRDAYPIIHPVYKPVASLFPPGNMNTGLNELNIAAKKSIILRVEANSILSWIYTYYEKKPEVSLEYTKYLCDEYPVNPYFWSLNLKNLMLLQRYDDAEISMDAFQIYPENEYFEAVKSVFKGLIQEKKYKNNELAETYYKEGLKELSVFGESGNEYSAYAFFGLSRIYEYSGDKPEAKKCHRKAMDLADFKDINFN